jgi:uncharacterized protein (DUF58 family)
MIRDYADPQQPQFTVLLDNRREIRPEPEFEEAVELAASLVVAAARADHRCQLVTPSGLDVVTTPGVGAVRRFQDELCLVEQSQDADLSLVPPALARATGGTLVVISSAVSARDQAALAALRPRYVDVVVVTLNGPPPGVPGVRVLRAANAVDATKQWQTVIAR